MTKAGTWVAAAAVVLGAVAGSGTALGSGATRSSSFGYVCLRCGLVVALSVIFLSWCWRKFLFRIFFARLTNLTNSLPIRALIRFYSLRGMMNVDGNAG